MSISVISNFKYDGGEKQSKATNTQPNNYCIRAKDMNDISNCLNGLIATINIHEEQIHDLTFSNKIDLSQYVTSIKLNGLTYQPTNGLIDLGNITAGENIGINNITVNGSTSGVSINGNTANITIDIPELPTIATTLTANSTNNTVAGSKAVVDYVSSYVENQLINAGSHTHANKELLDNISTYISSQVSGKVDKIEGKGLSTNDFTTTEKTKLEVIEPSAQVNIINSITVNGKKLTPDPAKTIEIKNSNFELRGLSERSYNSLTDKPTISGQTITGEISGLISSVISDTVSISNDFSLSELKEKSYNSLDNIPTISGKTITGEISGIINSLIKNNLQNYEFDFIFIQRLLNEIVCEQRRH
jgi:hypothetical protein